MTVAETVPVVQAAPPSTTSSHIRGSSLLLVGKIIAQLLEFGSQILLVRYLSKADFGAFSYALSFALLCKGIAMFGLPDTISRFVPLYRENKQTRAMMGSVVLAFGVVLGIGLLFTGGIDVALSIFKLQPTDDPQALKLLVILAFLVPVEALDGLFTNLFAAFASPRIIFFRQSFLTPGLRMGLVLLLTMLNADVVFLTFGYLMIGVVGVLLYAVMFLRILRQQDLLSNLHLGELSYPVREIFSFALPLLSTALVWLLIESSDAILLGYFYDTEAVANFRAVLPVARLNQGVILTFGLLYLPLASKLFARKEHGNVATLYWQTALWMTVLTTPIFFVTFGFSRSLTITLFGERYMDSMAIMTLLSLGYFFHTALGFNGLTLKVYNKLRYNVAVDIIAAILNVLINLILIPQWGALGAAFGTAGTLLIHNAMKQYGLRRYTGISLFNPRYIRTYSNVIFAAAALLLLQTFVLPISVWLALPLSAIASLIILVTNWQLLEVEEMFPEVTRWPIIGRMVRLLSRASS